MPRTVLSSADDRKPVVLHSALVAFARGGFHGTTVADVAREAGISPAYVFKLFPNKERLFVAALEECFVQIVAALERGADEAPDQSPDGILEHMGDAYATLIGDRTLLALQVHAQSVAEVPEVRAALQAGLERVTNLARRRSGADGAAVQRFIAFGQLCHLLAMTGVDRLDDEWALVLSEGIRHP